MNSQTQTNQTQTQNRIEMSVAGYIISIKREDDVIIKVEATPYLGKLYTVVSYVAVDENCKPIFRTIVPPWVWRRIKKMIKNGASIRQIEEFVFYAAKDFVSINITDRHGGSKYRIYYEEPYRLLSHFFSPQPPEKRDLFSNPPRVFRCACNKS